MSDRLDTISLHMGAIQKGVENLEHGMNKINDTVFDLKEDITTLKVKVGDGGICQMQHKALNTTIREMQQAIHKPKPIKGIKYWLGIVTGFMAMLTFIGGVGWSLVRLGQYVGKKEEAVKQLKMETRTSPYKSKINP